MRTLFLATIKSSRSYMYATKRWHIPNTNVPQQVRRAFVCWRYLFWYEINYIVQNIDGYCNINNKTTISLDMSTSSDSDPRAYRARSPGSGRSLSSRVDTLASTLQDTNRNLKDVDRLLEDYKDMGERKQSAVDRLKDDLNRTEKYLMKLKLNYKVIGQFSALKKGDTKIIIE